jgi:hypothetical protein
VTLNQRFGDNESALPMIGSAHPLVAVILIMIVWVLCIILGCRNLIRAEESPHWIWISLLNPLFALAIFVISLILVQEHKAKLARQEAEARRLAAERDAEARRLAAEQHAAAQCALSLRLTSLVSDAKQTASSLPTLVRSAENALDLAEREFQDGAFAPFWDAVEQATKNLANFVATVRRLIRNSQLYNGEAAKLETPPPPFRIGIDTLPDASRTADRMRAVVRQAQKDFHFATIYEQRKTNQLIVVGFSTLGQAISELGGRLESSLDQLASAVDVSISEITASHERMTSVLTTELERSREQAERASEARRDHERKEREMLDNIQRRRKPWP